MKDKHGNTVELGDTVRVVEICQQFLDVLSDEELVHIKSMINQEYEIDGFPENDKVSVSMTWVIEEGMTGHAGLYMLSNEFELARKATSCRAE